jgi:hypothetical protein
MHRKCNLEGEWMRCVLCSELVRLFLFAADPVDECPLPSTAAEKRKHTATATMKSSPSSS